MKLLKLQLNLNWIFEMSVSDVWIQKEHAKLINTNFESITQQVFHGQHPVQSMYSFKRLYRLYYTHTRLVTINMSSILQPTQITRSKVDYKRFPMFPLGVSRGLSLNQS